MANRYFQQFLFGFNHMLTYLEGNFVVGATGAVGTLKGSGIKSVVRLNTGIYQINLSDPYPRYLHGDVGFVSPFTGSPVASTALVTGTAYEIAVVGTTNWSAVGFPAGVTPLVGMSFVATGTTAGTGTALAAGSSGVASVEVFGDPNLTLSCTQPYIILQCFDYAGALVDPANHSVFGFEKFLRNSSVKGKGE